MEAGQDGDVREIRTLIDLRSVLEAGQGYIYNAFPSQDPAMCPVHHVTCRHTAKMLVVEGEHLLIPKLWSSDLHALLKVVVRRQRSYRLCGSERALPEGGVAESFDRRTLTVEEAPEPAELAATPDQVRLQDEAAPSPPSGSWYDLAHHSAGVQYSSSHRLTFFAKDWRAAAQRELAAAVRGLNVGEEEMVAALYTSEDRSLADAENVLLYNLWPFGLNRVPGTGVRFERSFHPPPDDSSLAPYRNRYSVVPKESAPFAWVPGTTVLSFEEVELPARMPTRCSPIWWAIKNSPSRVARLPSEPLEVFGVSLTLTVPDLRPGVAPAWIKVLFDGAIAAGAFDDTAEVRQDLAEVAAQVDGTVEVVRRHLADASSAPLGGLHMARRGGGGLQLSPPDDYCVLGQLSLLRATGGPPRLTGRIFSVSPLGGVR